MAKLTKEQIEQAMSASAGYPVRLTDAEYKRLASVGKRAPAQPSKIERIDMGGDTTPRPAMEYHAPPVSPQVQGGWNPQPVSFADPAAVKAPWFRPVAGPMAPAQPSTIERLPMPGDPERPAMTYTAPPVSPLPLTEPAKPGKAPPAPFVGAPVKGPEAPKGDMKIEKLPTSMDPERPPPMTYQAPPSSAEIMAAQPPGPAPVAQKSAMGAMNRADAEFMQGKPPQSMFYIDWNEMAGPQPQASTLGMLRDEDAKYAAAFGGAKKKGK